MTTCLERRAMAGTSLLAQLHNAPAVGSCGSYIYIYIPRHSVCAIYADQLGVVLGVHGAAVLWQSHGVYGIYLYNPTS